MADVSEVLREAIIEVALAPWPQARFLMMVGLMTSLPRTEADVGIEVLSCPGLATTVMVEAIVAPMTIATADGVVVIDPDEQVPFLDLVDLIDRLSRHEVDQDRIRGFEAIVICALGARLGRLRLNGQLRAISAQTIGQRADYATPRPVRRRRSRCTDYCRRLGGAGPWPSPSA